MKKILTASAAVALLAAPALAQAPSAQTAYEQQIRAIYQQLDALPGSSAHQRQDLLQQAMAVKAEAFRHGIMIETPPKPEATAAR